MSARAIGWRRSRFTRTILGMRVPHATVARLVACSLAGGTLACGETPRPRPRPPDAGLLVTVYLAPKAADRLARPPPTGAARRPRGPSRRTANAGPGPA